MCMCAQYTHLLVFIQNKMDRVSKTETTVFTWPTRGSGVGGAEIHSSHITASQHPVWNRKAGLYTPLSLCSPPHPETKAETMDCLATEDNRREGRKGMSKARTHVAHIPVVTVCHLNSLLFRLWQILHWHAYTN